MRWSGDEMTQSGAERCVQQIVGHEPRLHQWEQVPTRKNVDRDVESVSSDPALQADRKEAVIRAGEDPSSCSRPPREVTHRLKGDVGLGALIRLALGRGLGVDVVQEVGLYIKGPVATGAGRLLLGLERTRVHPPVARCLTWV